MRKSLVLLVMMMLLVLCLAPKVSEAKLGAFVGPFSPNFEEINSDLDEAVNKEFGTNLRLEGKGLIYSIAAESRTSLCWTKGIDISFYQTKTSDSCVTISHPPDMPTLTVRQEVDFDIQVTAMPIFLTRIYQKLSIKGLSPYVGVGVGTVLTISAVSRKRALYFIDLDGNVQDKDTQEDFWSRHFTSVPLAGQVLAGIKYWLGKRTSLLLEARYIASSKAKIRDEKFETGIDWSGFSYGGGLIFNF